LVPNIPAQDDPGTALNLSDIFETRPAQGGLLPGAGRYDPEGPMLVIPDTSLWRMPAEKAAPAPRPMPELPPGYVLPDLDALIVSNDPMNILVDGEPMRFRGLQPGMQYGERP